MPNGKPAGVRCIQLSDDNRCRIFGHSDRPAVCSSLMPEPTMCGQSDQEAFQILTLWEDETKQDRDSEIHSEKTRLAIAFRIVANHHEK